MGISWTRFAFGAAAFATLVFASAAAETAEVTSSGPLANRLYFFAGADVGHDTGFAWIGTTVSPLGRLDEDGVRIRLFGGKGYYRYNTPVAPGGENTGEISTGEIMIGKRLLFDPMTITAYIGLDIRDYRLQHPDPRNPQSGGQAGVKAALEIYLRTAPDYFATGYANISSIFQNYSVRAAFSREFTPAFSLGIEGALLGDTRYHEERAGLIASMRLAKNILSLASGIARNSDKGSGPYTTLTLYSPF